MRRKRQSENPARRPTLRQRELTLETLEPRMLLAANPLITEFMASNGGSLLDGNGNSSDWIEIYNAGDAFIDLAGWHLTDNAANLDNWTFPDLPASELDPGEYLVVFASGTGAPDLAGNLHTDFGLSAAGEYVGLVRPDLTVASEYGPGGTNYPAQRSDVSYGVQGSAPPALAGITYYDADEEPGGNTAGLYAGWTPRGAGAGVGSDQNFGNEGGTLQTFGAVGEIATTVAGLDPNQTYDVFVFFWDDLGSSSWNVQAGLASGSLTDFDVNSPEAFSVDSATQFPGSSQLVSGLNVLGQGSDTYDDWVDGNRTLYAAVVGQTGGSTTATVYVDHNSSLSDRTFYDGIGLRPTGNLVGRESAAEYLIPINGNLGTNWTANNFNAVANGFSTGQASIGYENDTTNNDDDFTEEILTTMPSGTTSVYVRTEFNLEDASAVTGLILNMKYDDGFAAYLNGTPVASQFAPANPAYNSTATGFRSDAEALEYQEFSLTGFVGELVDGQNTLAIHALNRANSTDFLMSPQLTLSTGTLEFGEVVFHTTPTPGGVNGLGVEGFVGDATFSVDRGFFDAPFSVAIATPETPTAEIYYTVDGSVPGPQNPSAILYTAPVSITTTTNLRASGYVNGFEPATVGTQTYIFLDDVFAQDPINNPQNGLSYPTTWQGGFAGDYTIDSRVVTQWDDDNPVDPSDFGIREALQSLPTISLTLPHEDLWGTGSNGSGGIYPNATSQGQSWRRPGSVEYFDPATGDQFQYNVGIQMQGAASRDNNRLLKHSFRLVFNSDFDGPGRLRFPLFDNSDFDNINTVALKASFTDAFATRSVTNRYSPLDSLYMRDVWMRDAQLAMGNPVADSTYAHLYINGLYWGLYWPAERNDDAFLAARIGGAEEDWDIVRDFNELFRGERDAYDQMIAVTRQIDSASSSVANVLFQQIQGKNPDGSNDPSTDALLDVDNFIDYIILHLYAGVEDWPSHNWYAARNRVDPGDGFIFMTWDQEISLDQLYRDRTSAGNSNTPGEIFQNMRNSSEFRLRFADRVQKHLFNDGALTIAAAQARFMQRSDQIEAGIIGESARWGDAREGQNITAYTSLGPFGDGHIPTGGQTVPLMTVDHWREARDYVHDSYLVNAGGLLISRLTGDSLYTTVAAPSFRINGIPQHGGLIATDDSLSIAAPGTVYYTLDGSDPRGVDGLVVGALYNGPINLDATTVVKARTFSGGQWSALSEAVFTVPNSSLVISEFNYNPYIPTTPAELAIAGIDNDDFEFIELLNTHPTDSINLQNVQLGGSEVSFTFGNVVLAPGERIVVVEDIPAFEARYGTSVNVAGQWSGRLNNGGGSVALLDAVGETIMNVEYNDRDPWAQTADGAGATLVLDDPAGTPADQLGKYYRWRGSAEFGGTPGADSAALLAVVINEVVSHTDLPAKDSIELFNPTASAIDISGWFLSDSDGDLLKYEIPDGTILGAGQFVVFNEDDFNPTPATPGPKDFALNGAEGDEVWLVVPTAGGTAVAEFVDQVSFDGMFLAESFGRIPNGAGRLAPLASTTFGVQNSAPRVGPVVISEVNYHPENPSSAAQNAFQLLAPGQTLVDDDLEFIEIHNPTASTVDLTDWQLRGESDFNFAAGTMLGAGASLVVVSFDPAADAARLAGFRTHYGIGAEVAIVGDYNAHLNNSFARVELERPDTPPINNPTFTPHVTEDEVLYDDLAPWPTSVDGLGHSLHRTTASAYGNDAASWTGATPTPGSASLAVESADFNNDNAVTGFDFLAWQRGFGTASGATPADGDANSDGAVNAVDLGVWEDQFGVGVPLVAAASDIALLSEAPLPEASLQSQLPAGVWIDYSARHKTDSANADRAFDQRGVKAIDLAMGDDEAYRRVVQVSRPDYRPGWRASAQDRDEALARWDQPPGRWGIEDLWAGSLGQEET